MQLKTFEAVSVVHQIRCDRCGKEVERGEVGFGDMTSIGFNGGFGSIFGDGTRVEVDLCEPCLRDTLGAWLRINLPANTPLTGKSKQPKAAKSVRPKSSSVVQGAPHSLESLYNKSPAEAADLMRKAGIITKSGKLRGIFK